jgi:arylsulfatase A-like enzyme
VSQPVEQVDIAATACAIAGIPQPDWMQGKKLPASDDGTHQRAICEWDSQFPGYGMHFRSIYRDGYVLTRYEPSTAGQPNGLETHFPAYAGFATDIRYDGTEGELYDLKNDPHQFENLWNDPKSQGLKCDLTADLLDNLAPERAPKLEVVAPA